jgi:hypothetical protein
MSRIPQKSEHVYWFIAGVPGYAELYSFFHKITDWQYMNDIHQGQSAGFFGTMVGSHRYASIKALAHNNIIRAVHYRFVAVLLLFMAVGSIASAQPVWQSTSGTINSGAVNTNRPTFLLPSGTVAGDLLVVTIFKESNTVDITAPTIAWKQISDHSVSGFGIETFYTVAGASEPLFYTFGASANVLWAGSITRITGADPVKPITSGTAVVGASGATITAPSVNSFVNNSLILSFLGKAELGTALDLSVGSPATQRLSAQSQYSHLLGTYVKAVAGATGTITVTPTTGVAWAAQQLVIAPAQGTFAAAADTGWVGRGPYPWQFKARTSRNGPSNARVNTKYYINDKILGYLEYLPQGYYDPANANKTYPLIVYAPGKGEQPDVGVMTLSGGQPDYNSNLGILIKPYYPDFPYYSESYPSLPRHLRDNGDYFSKIPLKVKGQPYDGVSTTSAIVICIGPAAGQMANKSDYRDILTKLKTDPNFGLRIDPARIFITGMSLGGTGSWDYAGIFNEEKIAGIVPVCARTSIYENYYNGTNPDVEIEACKKLLNAGTNVLIITNLADMTVIDEYINIIGSSKNSGNSMRTAASQLGIPSTNRIDELYFDYGVNQPYSYLTDGNGTTYPNPRTHDAWSRAYVTRNLANGAYIGTNIDPAPQAVYINNGVEYTSIEWMMATQNLFVLPVTLKDFTANREGLGVMTKWVTSEESRSDYFTVERSEDGRNFTAIGKVAAAGNSSYEKKYNFFDAAPPTGVYYLYYRLKQTDKDGRTEYFKTRRVYMGAGAGTYRLYPTVTNNSITLEFKTARPEVTSVRVIDAAGKHLRTYTVPARQIRTNFDVSFLSKGIYFLQIISGENMSTEKFIKQ